MTKEYILKNLINKRGSITNSTLKRLNVKESVSELYLIYSETKRPLCVCGKETYFKGFIKGFGEYCSVKCMSNSSKVRNKTKNTNLGKYGVENPMYSEEIKDRLKKTNLEKYGVENVYQSEEIKEKIKKSTLEKTGFEFMCQTKEVKNKIHKTAVENGTKKPVEDKTDWERYLRIVHRLTSKEMLENLDNFEFRALAGVEGGYQLDHKYSVYMGFKNNIPVHIISNINNLEMLPWRENSTKNKKSSIDLDKLIERIYN